MIPGVLDDHDRRLVEEQFGVDSDQVMRDHAISHVLAAIAGLGTDDIVFFGGTALARTHLPELRLSEDIDLIALRDRRDTADRIETAVTQGVRRSLGAAVFTPRLRETRHPAPSVLQVGDARIQVQVLSSIGYPAWPTEVREIEQRYRDAPPAQLRVLAITSVIGLLHGLGFSFVLHEILRVDSPNIWQSLLAFNVGVEIGQLIIICLAWPLFRITAAASQQAWHWGQRGIASVCAATALFWTGERALTLLSSLS